MSDLADCCPRCDPFDSTALPPLVVAEEPERPGTICVFYRCLQGHHWTCWWDAKSAGWPARRNAA